MKTRKLASVWHQPGLATLLLAILTCVAAAYLWPGFHPAAPAVAAPWIPDMGISLSLRVDGLSWLFLAVIGVVACAVFSYARAYMHNKPGATRFWVVISLFYLAMLGIVVADDLILLFIFWELTSISSYLLISFYHDKKTSRQSALNALLITGGGGLALLAGIVMLGYTAGTYQISEILNSSSALAQSSLLAPIAVLFLIGAFTKSAQYPFHFWLPGAMSAPAPVSALLHSATMVKAGVFLLLRFNPLFNDITWYQGVLILFGSLTMAYGAVLSLTYRDLKRVLANTTISGLGVLVMLIGVGTPLAMKGAMLFFVVHALYKSSLFMIAGSIEKLTGSRDISQLRGLKSKLPGLYYASLLAACSMAGLPLFVGFVGKEVIYEALLGGEQWVAASLLLALITNAAIFATGFVVTLKPFLGNLPAGLTVKQPTKGLYLPALALGALGLLLGAALPLLSHLLDPVAHLLMATDKPLKLSLWHGVNLPLMLSVLTVFLGVVLYRQFRRFQALGLKLERFAKYEFANLFEQAIYGLITFAKHLTAVVQNGKLRHYLGITMLTTMGLLMLVFIQEDKTPPVNFSDLQLEEFFVGMMIVAAVVGAMITRSKMAGALELGVLGVGTTLFFVLYGGPDLAMTQVLVESLTVILFVLVIYKLPNPRRISSRGGLVRDIALSLFVGATMFVITLNSFKISLYEPVSDFYKDVSYLEAYGKNIVNVILVDFRALDTLGEGLVLALAAFGIFVLLKYKRPVTETQLGATDA